MSEQDEKATPDVEDAIIEDAPKILGHYHPRYSVGGPELNTYYTESTMDVSTVDEIAVEDDGALEGDDAPDDAPWVEGHVVPLASVDPWSEGYIIDEYVAANENVVSNVNIENLHDIQKSVANTQELEDEQLIEKVVSAWESVCEENESQRNLVTASQFDQWVNFRDIRTQWVKDIVERFSEANSVSLSDDDREVLQGIARQIVTAVHKTPEQILEDNSKNEAPQEAAEAQGTLTRKETNKISWISRLKKLFKR